MAEEGPFFKMSVGMSRHPKIAAAGGDAAWLWACGLDYCAEYKTDGLIPARLVPQLSDRRQPARLARLLVDNDLWHGPGHHCKRCVQPMAGYYIVHDYLEHQRSAEEVQAARDAKEAGGAYGNHRRWHAGRGQFEPGCSYCLASESHMRLDNRSGTDHIADGKRVGERSVRHRSGIADLEGSLRDPERSPPTPPAGGKTRRKAYNYAGDQDFLRFWDVFPAKRGKPEAYDAWLKALSRGTDPEVIIAAAQRYRDDPSRDPAKTKYPQGWLSGERYNDEPEPGPPAADSDDFWGR